MRIDVHSHYYPKDYVDLIEGFGTSDIIGVIRSLDAGREGLEARFAMMKSARVDMQVLSVPPLLPYLQNEKAAVDAARYANNLYADIVREYPDKFAAFACTPFPHVKATLTELARSLGELGMIGVTATTSVLGKSLADPSFEPFFEELDRRRAVLFIHPSGDSAGSPQISDYGLNWVIGAPIEDTVCLLHLFKSGIMDNYPNVRMIMAQLGGTFPFLAARIDHYSKFMPPGSEKPTKLARRLWYDTVNAYGPSLRASCETFGSDRIVLGTDFPYWKDEFYSIAVRYVENSGLSKDDVHRILDENAEKLLDQFPTA
ncbi:MAG: amidohydrolase family protein [Nitrososphaerales archaeon]